MSWSIKKDQCLRCGACVAVCPQGALTLTEHGVKVDSDKCVSCGICQKMCPVGAIEVNK